MKAWRINGIIVYRAILLPFVLPMFIAAAIFLWFGSLFTAIGYLLFWELPEMKIELRKLIPKLKK